MARIVSPALLCMWLTAPGACLAPAANAAGKSHAASGAAAGELTPASAAHARHDPAGAGHGHARAGHDHASGAPEPAAADSGLIHDGQGERPCPHCPAPDAAADAGHGLCESLADAADNALAGAGKADAKSFAPAIVNAHGAHPPWRAIAARPPSAHAPPPAATVHLNLRYCVFLI